MSPNPAVDLPAKGSTTRPADRSGRQPSGLGPVTHQRNEPPTTSSRPVEDVPGATDFWQLAKSTFDVVEQAAALVRQYIRFYDSLRRWSGSWRRAVTSLLVLGQIAGAFLYIVGPLQRPSATPRKSQAPAPRGDLNAPGEQVDGKETIVERSVKNTGRLGSENVPPPKENLEMSEQPPDERPAVGQRLGPHKTPSKSAPKLFSAPPPAPSPKRNSLDVVGAGKKQASGPKHVDPPSRTAVDLDRPPLLFTPALVFTEILKAVLGNLRQAPAS